MSRLGAVHFYSLYPDFWLNSFGAQSATLTAYEADHGQDPLGPAKLGKPLGSNPTVGFYRDLYLGWNVANPQGELSLIVPKPMVIG
jgi:hypothetical protein